MRVRLALTSVLAALAIAGCDRDDDDDQERLSKSDYQAAILDVLNDSVGPAGLYTDMVVRPRPEEECERMIGTFHDQVNDLVERVAALEPPSEVASIQDDFVAAARRSVDQVEAVERQVSAGEVSCGRQLNDSLYGMPSSDRAQRAIAELQEHGYFVSGD